MYSFQDVENIKTNLEWIVHQTTISNHSPTKHDQKVIFSLLTLIQTYETLLELISQYGVTVIDSEVAEGLSITEKFIAKVKRNDGCM
ncbi:hypothetical protein [Enterobacter roggenkampii]|uniref:hypothetical protein n=1 Tax=Enterobacter roggenkampii TaxID=1812935 RepID=UPI00389A6B6B